MTDNNHFQVHLAQAGAALKKACDDLAALPQSSERTVLMNCIDTLINGIRSTWVYYAKVTAPPDPTAEPPLNADDTHPYIPVRLEE